jgi:putative ABC transport system substrate-binding protein
VRRRAFSASVAGFAAAVALRPPRLAAQQKTMPVIGWLNSGSPGPTAPFLAAFRQGLGDNGFVEGQTVAIEYRWAEDRNDWLPALAAELVARKVDVIVTGASGATARAARDATATIPIVFGTGDPVASGLVTNLARPDGNLTGVGYIVGTLTLKRFDLLLQAVPQAKVIGLLVNPKNTYTAGTVTAMEEAAHQRGVQLLVVRAASEGEVDAAFASLAQGRAGALVVQADPYLHSRRGQLLSLVVRYALPAAYTWGELAAEGGGLMSYGPSLTSVYRQIGSYAGRILKGARPADLPVVQPATFELIVNMKMAKALGLTLPPSILALADEVIE